MNVQELVMHGNKTVTFLLVNMYSLKPVMEEIIAASHVFEYDRKFK
jgi:hypothetical protein